MNEPIDTDYDTDFLLWINRQVELLRAKQFDQLDLENLIEELDAMARRDKRELASRIRVLMMHLLKCRAQPEHISSHWRGTLDEQRIQIALLLQDMPSLKNAVDAYMQDAYPDAVRRAAGETGLPPSAFPASCPFSKEQLLDRNYIA